MGAQRGKSMSTSAGVPMTEPGGKRATTPDGVEQVVKMSVKVPVSDHRALARMRLQMSEDLGGKRVTDQDVMAALVAVVLDDPDLMRNITESMR